MEKVREMKKFVVEHVKQRRALRQAQRPALVVELVETTFVAIKTIMKKIILLLLLPFIIHAQKPSEKKARPKKYSVNAAPGPVANKARQAAFQRIQGYRQRAMLGENMGTLARLYSEDPGSKQDGGMYRNITHGTMDLTFETVAFSLKPGEISKVFETEHGFHFIQLVARRGEVIDLRHILVTTK